MKKTILFASTIAIALVSTLFSCVESDKNLYDASFKMPNPMGEGFSAPDGFDWSTMNNVQATVEVNDEFDGKYYYVVELYDANPFISEDAHLLNKGIAKKGEPYTSEISIEKSNQTIYVKKTTPTGLSTVRTAAISNGTVICNFKSVNSTTRSMASTRSFVTFEEPGNEYFPTTSPTNDAFPNDWNAQINGHSYNLTKATSNSIDLGGKSNIKLYVTEDITLSNLYLASGCQIYILPGKTVTMSSESTKNSQTGALISVGDKAAFIVKGKIQIDKGFKLYCLGTINGDGLSYTNSASFYNAGTVNIKEELSGENNNCAALNSGSIKANKITLRGGSHFINRGKVEVEDETTFNSNDGSWENDGEWITEDMNISAWNNYNYNRCKLIVKEELNLTEAFIVVDAGASVKCKSLYMNNSRIDLGAKSLFVVTEEAEYNYQTSDKGFKGTGAEKALLKIEAAEAMDSNKGNIIHYSGNLQIICSDHPKEKTDKGEIRWTMTNGAEWGKEGSNTISIPKTECNEGYNGGTPTPPVDPSFPIIVEDNKNYAYIFEDQWPLYGDYDLNDIVMVINKRKLSVNKKNLVEKFELSIDLCAVGATKKLGAAIMLDGVKASDIKSPVEFEDNNIINSFNLNDMKIEKGQNLAVIPLFDDAHIALGRTRYEAINTSQGSQNNTKNKTINLTIEFSTPTLSADAFNINKLNLFIFNNLNRDVRREVHVIGFQPTKLAETDIFGNNNDNSSFSNKKYYISKENLAWGIMVPANFKWPLEYVNIKNAYPEFESWVTSGGKENDKWWNGFNVDKVFQTNKN